jgi:hypothetical protein
MAGAVRAEAEIDGGQMTDRAPMAWAWTLMSGYEIIERRLTWTKDDPFIAFDGSTYVSVGVPLYTDEDEDETVQ